MEIVYRSKRWTPATIGSNETTALLSVSAGERIVCASYRIHQLAEGATGSTVEVGDGADTDGYVATTDTESGAVGDLVNGAGAYLATSGGKLYNAADTIDLKYVASGTPGTVKPIVEVKVGVVREWPS